MICFINRAWITKKREPFEEGIVFSMPIFAATKGILDAIFEPIVEKKLFSSLLISSLSINVFFFL